MNPVKKFIARLLNPDVSLGAADYYALMLSFDILCFLTIIFGYSSFGVRGEGETINFKGEIGSVKQYVEKP